MPISFRLLFLLAVAALTCFGLSPTASFVGGSLMLTAVNVKPRFVNVGGNSYLGPRVQQILFPKISSWGAPS